MAIRKNREFEIQKEIVRLIPLKYPKVLFHSDLSGMYTDKLTAAINSALNPYRGHPDIIFYEKRGNYIGLAIELKSEGVRLKKKNGEYASPHIAEQAKYLEYLNQRSWFATFATGLDEALFIIDNYLINNFQALNIKI